MFTLYTNKNTNLERCAATRSIQRSSTHPAQTKIKDVQLFDRKSTKQMPPHNKKQIFVMICY